MTYSAIIIGTGFSGLVMAIKLKERGIHDFLLLEKAAEIGGTWRENTYPGAECDIPSALYSYSFEPYPDWEYKWSHQPQILRYLKYVGQKYELYPHIRFQQQFTGAEWQAESSVWQVKTANRNQFTTKNLITAVGQLHYPSIPNFKGKNSFQGESFHSAKWNHNIDLTGKTVGVIGNAASAVQFIPEIAKTAEKVVVFQRSANWLLPKQDRLYKTWEKNLVRRFPLILQLYRLKIWLLGGALFLMMKNGNNWLRNFYQWQTKRYIRREIDDPILQKKLIPNYPMGAKRLLFSDEYYTALNRKNVEVLTDGIDQITASGIILKNGHQQSVDVLIYSTGFKTNPFLMGLQVVGRNEVTIQEAWKDEPKNYLGMTASGFPNFYILYGPNTNLGHNSIILMAEAQAKYIAECVFEMNNNHWKTIEIKADIVDKYHAEIQQRLSKMIWATIDNSWYQSANGNIPNNWPGRTMEYRRRTRRVDFSKYDIE